MADRYKGRVFGRSVMEIYFRSYYEEEVHLGDILVVEDTERDFRFYLRVIDLFYGTEATDPDWAVRTAGNMMLMDNEDQNYDLHDRGRRLYKIGKCIPLGILKNGEFRKPKTVPTHFSCVKNPTEKDFAFLKKFMGDVEVGRLRSGEEIFDFPVGIQGELFPSHIGAFATTGMGKSNLMKTLAASVMELGKYSMMILDPHGEYYDGGPEPVRKGLKHHPLADERLKVYSSRRLTGPYNQLKLSASEIKVGDVRNLYSFSSAQIEALAAVESCYEDEWLVKLADMEIEALSGDLGGGGFRGATISVLKRRALSIMNLPFIHRDKEVTITHDVIRALRQGKLVLIDTSNMAEVEELLVSSVLARSIFEANRNAYQDERKFREVLPTLIVMEEAQRVLGKKVEGDTNIFAQISREGRKFNTGLCAITQQPKLIDEELLSQFNTLFILGLADERDRNILRSSAKQDISQLGNEIQTLMAGEVLITSPRAPFAIPAMIHLYEDWLLTRKRIFNKREQPIADKGFFE